jgi:hypothetical protein
MSFKQWLLVLLCIAHTVFSTESARLQYRTGIPYLQRNSILIEKSHALPGFKLDGTSRQAMEAEITLEDDNPSVPLASPPFNVIFVLTNLLMDLKINDHGVSFDARAPSVTLEQFKLKKIIDKPYKLRFDKEYHLDPNEGDFVKLLTDLNSFSSSELDGFIKEWFQHQFALAGKDLKVGDKITRMASSLLPIVWTYEVTHIDDKEVQAEVTGQMASKNIFSFNFPTDAVQGMGLTLEGEAHGKISWERQNALGYLGQLDFAISGIMKIGGKCLDNVAENATKHQLLGACPKTRYG